MTDLQTRLASGTLVADGAMGSMIARAFPNEMPVALARTLLAVNLSNPEIVHGIHLGYIGAGADIIETNTFGASHARLERLGLADQAAQVVSEAVKIARGAAESSGRAVVIAGALSPLDADWMLEQNPRPAVQAREFATQVELLLERGVEMILLETFSRLSELLLAATTVRQLSHSVPLVASMSFDDHGMLASGETAEIAARRLAESCDVAAVGVNCSLGPRASLAVLERMAAGTTLPLSIMPNAGFAQRVGGRVFYPDMTAAYYASFARDAREVGARIIGGCCGTTPQQIAAIATGLQDATATQPGPGRPRVQVRERAELVDEDLPGTSASQPSGLARRLQAREFVRTLQIDPQRGPYDAVNREVVTAVRGRNLVDLIDVISSGAGARQDSLQVSAGIEALGVETLAHITPRDASVAGVLSQVLGAYDWGGVRNVLVITGDPPRGDQYAEAKGVYQVDTIGLVRAIDSLRHGQRVNEVATLPPFPLTLGVALNQNAPDLEAELQRLEAKVEAGADFVMTQPFFSIEDWDRCLEWLAGRCALPVLIGVWPLLGYRQACRINENVTGVVVPEEVLLQLEAAGPSEREVGFQLASELLAEVERTHSAAGAYVVAPFKRPARGLEVFERIGARP